MAKQRTARCPVCQSETSALYRPFCSKRCADIDLGRWLNGTYAIAGREDDDDAETGEQAAANGQTKPFEA